LGDEAGHEQAARAREEAALARAADGPEEAAFATKARRDRLDEVALVRGVRVHAAADEQRQARARGGGEREGGAVLGADAAEREREAVLLRAEMGAIEIDAVGDRRQEERVLGERGAVRCGDAVEEGRRTIEAEDRGRVEGGWEVERDEQRRARIGQV